MSDVAERAGVSRALVSLVFRDRPGASERTRARVLAAAAEIGYRPDGAARLLARGRSRTVGVVTTVGEPYEADLLESIYDEAGRLGYDVLLSARTRTHPEPVAVEGLLAHRCEALVLLGPGLADVALAALGRRSTVAVVGRAAPEAVGPASARRRTVDSLRTADDDGVRQAVDHLVGLGHRAIVHVDGADGPNAAVRRDGYRDAMAAHGLAAHVRVLPGGYDEQAGTAAARALLDDPEPPTAVVAANDRCALGLLDTLWRAGVGVPGRMSVVGYNDDRLAGLAHVDLTTVRQDADALARGAVRAVAARLEDGTLGPTDRRLAPRLVVRGTTAPPADGG